MRARGLTALLLALATLLASRVGPAKAEIFQRAGPAAPSPAQPARDRPFERGTAVIRGRVYAADTKRPLRRAQVRATAPDLSTPRLVSTDALGRYELRELPAGRYTVSVVRSGYLELRFGQRRPQDPPRPIEIAEGQLVEGVDFALVRTSVVSGRLSDEQGEPFAGASVMALRSRYFGGRRRLVPTGRFATTDDLGQYRIIGLPPGEYYILATSRETWEETDGKSRRVFGYAPTYFPGTSTLPEAARVSVGLSQEVSGIDFALVPGRAVRVAGRALDATGRPLAGETVSLLKEFRGPNLAMVFQVASATTGGDGSFVLPDVPPGDYQLQVRPRAGGSEQDPEVASLAVSVHGEDLDGLLLVPQRGGTLRGQVVTDEGSVPELPPDRVRITAVPVGGELGRLDPGRAARVGPDWRFALGGVAGPQYVRVGGLPRGWMVRAVTLDDRDVTDQPVEVPEGATLALQVVLTRRVTEVTANVRDEAGRPTDGATLLVFAEDSRRWSEESRFVQAVRADLEGRYRATGLPPGAYLAVALADIDEGEWYDPEVLERLRPYATRLELGEGEHRTLTLRLTSLPP